MTWQELLDKLKTYKPEQLVKNVRVEYDCYFSNVIIITPRKIVEKDDQLLLK